ncbi:Uncharacterised protein [Enterobacter hormaechei]|nr:Uncharacterised protein [Enterobacter hormaechei]CZV88286.1 Uncharacterised protein [Enterobacter hormaechei]CZW74111.1 Uncharacterised protein [Enterobacter hormaechei]SAF71401.1 Uncharacterised protein [Enterobacter hormaechei]SAH10543.1 Uncharacterised protein [Enterobacter hormaechei]
MTLSEPVITFASQVVRSPMRDAGWLLMETRFEPSAICCEPSSEQSTVLSVASAAGLPLINTLGEPEVMTPFFVMLDAPASAMLSLAAVASSPV